MSPNGYQGPETHNERMLEQRLARANERIERLQAENDAFVLASTRETTATVTLNVAVAQRCKKVEAALKRIAGEMPGELHTYDADVEFGWEAAQEIAREALK